MKVQMTCTRKKQNVSDFLNFETGFLSSKTGGNISLYYSDYRQLLTINLIKPLSKSFHNCWLTDSFEYKIGYVSIKCLFCSYIPMTECMTAVTPLQTHWSYCSLALRYRFIAVLWNNSCHGEYPAWIQIGNRGSQLRNTDLAAPKTLKDISPTVSKRW